MDNCVMTKKRSQTSASLTIRAKEILQRHRYSHSVKAILSVGLELFDGLDAKERTERISRAAKEDEETRKRQKARRQAIKDDVGSASDVAAVGETAVRRGRRGTPRNK